MKERNIIFLFIITLFSACDRNSGRIEFIIKNKSDHNIAIDVPHFYNECRSFDTTFVLNKTTSICYSDFVMDCATEIPLDNALNITIYFDDTLSIRYYRNYYCASQDSSQFVASRYNPLLRENYSKTKHKSTHTYTYIFTNEDFEEAVRYNSTMK